MFIRCLSVVSLLGCHEKAKEPPPVPVAVEVRDGSGTVVAQLRPGHPCRATIGPIEMIIGGPPLVAQNGEVRWTGDSSPAGTTLVRDGQRVARVFPIGDPATAGVFDLNGVALARIAVQNNNATVSDAGGSVIRHVVATGPTAVTASPVIAIDHPALTVTGTSDLVLAALLSAPELIPEVRMLAACERVLVSKVP